MNEVKNNIEETEFSLSSLLRSIKQDFWVIILTTVLAFVIGFSYVSIVKPTYTATEKVAYKAENELQSTTSNNINAMNAFIGTIVDFCDEGVVVDRANFYYNGYLNEKREEDSSYDVKTYIDSIRAKDTYDGTVSSSKNIVAENISVKSEVAEEDAAKFFFYISYSDLDSNDAVDKVKILALAIDLECREKIVVNNKEEGKYFAGITSELKDLDTVGGAAVSNLSKSRIIILSVLAGLVVGFILVYIRMVSDKTIKDKTALEEIIGADLLAHIDKQEGL